MTIQRSNFHSMIGCDWSVLIMMAHKKKNEGQAVVEYLLLLSIVGLFSLTLQKGLITTFIGSLEYLGGELQKDLKTGRASLGIWKN